MNPYLEGILFLTPAMVMFTIAGILAKGPLVYIVALVLTICATAIFTVYCRDHPVKVIAP